MAGLALKGLEYECEIKYMQVGGSLDDAGYCVQRGDEVTVL